MNRRRCRPSHDRHGDAVTLTPERIAELMALAEQATPPPWLSYHDPAFGPVENTQEDLDFIAAARTALPEALTELTKARALATHWAVKFNLAAQGHIEANEELREIGAALAQARAEIVSQRERYKDGICRYREALERANDELTKARAEIERLRKENVFVDHAMETALDRARAEIAELQIALLRERLLHHP